MKLRIKFDFSECAKIEIVLVALIVLFTILRQSTAISICFEFYSTVGVCNKTCDNKKIRSTTASFNCSGGDKCTCERIDFKRRKFGI